MEAKRKSSSLLQELVSRSVPSNSVLWKASGFRWVSEGARMAELGRAVLHLLRPSLHTSACTGAVCML